MSVQIRSNATFGVQVRPPTVGALRGFSSPDRDKLDATTMKTLLDLHENIDRATRYTRGAKQMMFDNVLLVPGAELRFSHGFGVRASWQIAEWSTQYVNVVPVVSEALWEDGEFIGQAKSTSDELVLAAHSLGIASLRVFT